MKPEAMRRSRARLCEEPKATKQSSLFLWNNGQEFGINLLDCFPLRGRKDGSSPELARMTLLPLKLAAIKGNKRGEFVSMIGINNISQPFHAFFCCD